jgi:hypothetical protein
VLYYSSTIPRRLLAIDEIAVYPDRSTTVRRKVFGDPAWP